MHRFLIVKLFQKNRTHYIYVQQLYTTNLLWVMRYSLAQVKTFELIIN